MTVVRQMRTNPLSAPFPSADRQTANRPKMISAERSPIGKSARSARNARKVPWGRTSNTLGLWWWIRPTALARLPNRLFRRLGYKLPAFSSSVGMNLRICACAASAAGWFCQGLRAESEEDPTARRIAASQPAFELSIQTSSRT